MDRKLQNIVEIGEMQINEKTSQIHGHPCCMTKLKQIYRFNANPIEIQTFIFGSEIDKVL